MLARGRDRPHRVGRNRIRHRGEQQQEPGADAADDERDLPQSRIGVGVIVGGERGVHRGVADNLRGNRRDIRHLPDLDVEAGREGVGVGQAGKRAETWPVSCLLEGLLGADLGYRADSGVCPEPAFQGGDCGR